MQHFFNLNYIVYCFLGIGYIYLVITFVVERSDMQLKREYYRYGGSSRVICMMGLDLDQMITTLPCSPDFMQVALSSGCRSVIGVVSLMPIPDGNRRRGELSIPITEEIIME